VASLIPHALGHAPSAGASAAPNATLTLNLGHEVDTADPQVEAFDNDIKVSSLIFAPPLTLNAHNQVAANAATSMDVSPDGTTYMLTIRPGMTYSEGKPVTAGDYAFAIKRACDPVGGGQYTITNAAGVATARGALHVRGSLAPYPALDTAQQAG
jgi:oligopeptide transport system substrate-binding protein